MLISEVSSYPGVRGLQRPAPLSPACGGPGLPLLPIAADRLLAPASFYGRGEGGRIPNQVSSALLFSFCVFFLVLLPPPSQAPISRCPSPHYVFLSREQRCQAGLRCRSLVLLKKEGRRDEEGGGETPNPLDGFIPRR